MPKHSTSRLGSCYNFTLVRLEPQIGTDTVVSAAQGDLCCAWLERRIVLDAVVILKIISHLDDSSREKRYAIRAETRAGLANIVVYVGRLSIEVATKGGK